MAPQLDNVGTPGLDQLHIGQGHPRGVGELNLGHAGLLADQSDQSTKSGVILVHSEESAENALSEPYRRAPCVGYPSLSSEAWA